MIQLAGAEWEPGDGRRPSEGDLLGAGRLVLRSGRVTLGLLNGVTLTLEGPADLELLSIDRVHCRRGKLRTRVPRGAEGFIVSTPGSAVVDLGTEFGLNVAVDGKAQLMVFKGEAEAAVLNPAGAPVRSQQVAERRAFDIDPGRGQIEEAEARPADFVASPLLARSPLGLGASYREAVLAAGPWAYWRFEAIADGAVPDEVAGRPPLRATGPVKIVDAGDHNRCVEFGPDEAEQSMAMDGLWEPPSDPGYAVELWALPGRIGHAALASLIAPGPPAEDYKHLVLVELTASDRHSLVSPRACSASCIGGRRGTRVATTSSRRGTTSPIAGTTSSPSGAAGGWNCTSTASRPSRSRPDPPARANRAASCWGDSSRYPGPRVACTAARSSG